MSLDRTIRYVSAAGESIDFCAGGPWHASDTDLFDVNAPYASGNGAVMGFVDEMRTNALAARLSCGSLEDRDQLFDVFTADLANETPGRIYAGDWYCHAYITGVAVRRWHISDGILDCDLVILRTSGRWTHELSKFMPRSDRGIGLNYRHGYPYNYSGIDKNASIIQNPSVIPAPVSINIYGPAENPSVIIDGNHYEVEASVKDGGRLLINGATKKIALFDEYGNASNAFDKRRGVQREGSGSYIFHRLPQGAHSVQWDGSFGLDVTVYETREERRWAS